MDATWGQMVLSPGDLYDIMESPRHATCIPLTALATSASGPMKATCLP
ncbi:hypothetical protein LP419_28610 [Massilia sp. H-1]|nr:hypothetical protein LP419_28610 [Massilia sp. H-1]